MLEDYASVLLLLIPGIWIFGKKLVGERRGLEFPGTPMTAGILTWLLVVHLIALLSFVWSF